MFASWETMRAGRLRLVPARSAGSVEVEGAPDMVLEIVSESSVRKDTVTLRDMYWKAGVGEYWLVDARGAAPEFTILRHAPNGYEAVAPEDGWLASPTFGKRFRLTQQADELGNPQFDLAVE